MYPTLSHIIKKLNGFRIPLPVQTFGLVAGISGRINKKSRYIQPKEYATTIPLLALVFGIIGVERFLIGQVHVDTEIDFFGLQSKQAKLISIPIVITGIILLYTGYPKQKNHVTRYSKSFRIAHEDKNR